MSNNRVSPEAMVVFLKQAALEDQWTTAYLANALGMDGQTAKQLAAEMALTGYVDPDLEGGFNVQAPPRSSCHGGFDAITMVRHLHAS
jgi:hypothetical protein